MVEGEGEQDFQSRNHIEEMNAKSKSDFNKKYNWLLLCKTIAEWLTEPYYTTLHRNLWEILTFATLITEQVETLKLK